MKNFSKVSSNHNKSNGQITENKEQIQEIDLNQLAINIIENVDNEMNQLDSQELLQSLMQILQNFQNELINQLETEPEENQIKIILQNNFDTIIKFVVQCIQSFDNIRGNSIENLKNSLNQLFEIVSTEIEELSKNYNNNNKSNDNKINNDCQNEISKMKNLILSKQNKFVSLINSLSSVIRNYIKDYKQLIKELSSNTQNYFSELTKCKTDIIEIKSIFNCSNINGTLSNILKSKTDQINIELDNLFKINKDMINEIKAIDCENIKLYDSAKSIFQKLKDFHKIQIEELTNLEKQNDFSNQNYKKIKSKSLPKTRNNTVMPMQRRININNENEDDFNSNTYNSILNQSDKFKKGRGSSENRRTTYSNQETSNIHILNEINKNMKNEIDKYNNINIENNKSLKKKLPRSKSDRNLKIKTEGIQEIKNLSNDILILFKKMNNLQNSIMKKESNIQELKVDFEKFKKNLKEKVKLNLELINSNEQLTINKSIQDKNEELNNKFKELEINCQNYENMIEQLGKKINEKNILIEKLENEVNNNKKIELSQNKLKEYEDNLKKYEEKNKKLIEEIELKTKEINKLNDTLNKKEQLLEMPKSIKNDSKDNEEILKDNENIDFEDTIRNIKGSKEEKHFEKIENDLKMIKNKKDNFEKENKDLQNKILSLNDEINILLKTKEKLEEDNKILLTEIEELKKNSEEKNNILKPNNDDLKYKNLENENLILKEENKNLKENNKKLETQFSNEKKQNENKLKETLNLVKEMKNKINKNENEKEIPNYKKELIICSNIILNLYKKVNEKEKKNDKMVQSVLNKNPNEGLLIVEEDLNEEEDTKSEEIKDFDNINDLIKKNKLYYLQIKEYLNQIKKNNSKKKIEMKNKFAIEGGDTNKLENENKFLKDLITECIHTIFSSIKEKNPEFVDEEDEEFKNINQKKEFDKEFVKEAVQKFELYNNLVNEQFNQLKEDKLKLENELHNLQIKSKTYKEALDNAINKINQNNISDELRKSNNEDSKENNSQNNKMKVEHTQQSQNVQSYKTFGIEDNNSKNLEFEEEKEEIIFDDDKPKKKNNHTFTQIKSDNNVLNLLNKENNNEAFSFSDRQKVRIEELIKENKKLEENESLLLTQLSELKKELKQNRDIIENLKGKNFEYCREFLYPLRNALERLIFEIKLTNKIKEVLNIILSLASYTDEQIQVMYQYKEKKKNFFNMFPLEGNFE